MTRSARPNVTIWADGNGTVVASGALVSTYVDDFRHIVDAEDGSGGADGLVLDLTAVTEMDPAAAAAVAGIAADPVAPARRTRQCGGPSCAGGQRLRSSTA